MATIHVNRSGTSLGTFSEEEAREGLRSGRLLGTDLGWKEGMAEWQALARFPEFAEASTTMSAAGVPHPVGALPPTIAPGGTMPGAIARNGLPWDNRESLGFFTAFLETMKLVLTAPAQAFSRMRREGGLFNPLLYAIVGGSIGFIAAMLYQFAFQALGVSMGNRDAFNMMGMLGISSIFIIILAPVFVAIGLFIGAAIIHLCLMLVGGAKQPFETTFRVMSYTHGSVGIIQLIPVCGGIVAGIWGLVANCIGLARAHEIETGRAVLAVLLPVIVCCGLVVIGVVMAGGFAAFQHSH